MKILEQVDITVWKHQFTCCNCDAKLEAEPSDIKYKYYTGDQRELSYETFSVYCAVCGQEEFLNNQKMPKALIAKLRKSGNSK